jgi:hypothetical protein
MALRHCLSTVLPLSVRFFIPAFLSIVAGSQAVFTSTFVKLQNEQEPVSAARLS